jgi:putative ABC transport system permease protein
MKTILYNFISVLQRYRLATILNIMGLSVAFAAFMVIMMQVDYDRNFDRMHPNADRIYRVEVGGVKVGLGNEWMTSISRPLAEAFMQSSPHIQGGTFWSWNWDAFFSVETNGQQRFYEEKTLHVSPGYVDVFTFDMLEGSDRALDDPEKTLIPQSLATKLFGSEPATGKLLTGRGGSAFTVGGVYRDFPRNCSVQNVMYFSISKDENLHSWGNWNYTFFIRTDAPENVEGLLENFKRTFDTSTVDEWNARNISNMSLRFTPLPEVHYITGVGYDRMPKASRQTLLILFGIAFVIVLIAGINYMNFSAALAPKRIRSINTQKVFGGDERVIRVTLVMEAAGLCLIAWAIAVALVHLAQFTLIASLVDADIALTAHLRLVSGTALIALLTGVLAGVYPAFYMTSFPPVMALKGNFGLSLKGRQLRTALVSVQFIASFALIIGASFMYLQNHFMLHTSLGYDKDALIVTNMNNNIKNSRDAFTDQLKSFAGVEAVTYSYFLLSSSDSYMGWGRDYHDKQINYQCLPVEPSFLEVMGIQVSEGRGFRIEDANTRHGVYVFNEKARNDFGLELNNRIDSAEIVGFMPDVKFASLRQEVIPMAFFVWGTQNWGITPDWAYVKVKAGADLHAAMTHVRSTLKNFDDTYPFDVRFFDEVLNRTYENEQKLSSLITLFSLVAILISIVGVFGLVVFDSEYRRKEIGIRRVFGSTTGEILVIFNKTYIRILCLCFVPAAPLAWYAVNKWLESFAYRTPMYWWVYLVAFGIVFLLTVGTVTFQNWRAAHMNPVESIRSE